MEDKLPIPPDEMRALVGPTDLRSFDNPSGVTVVPEVGERGYGDVLDFGCGCGRVARQFIQQRPQPRSYLGVDLHAGMIRWCKENLAPAAPQFDFVHHDVFNPGFNPAAEARVLDFPAEPQSFDLILAKSVFTHLEQDRAIHYLRECARVLKRDGALFATWFLFDKRYFPMMQSFQNALYINLADPTNAVIFDRAWFLAEVESAGLTVTVATPPAVRGYHWEFLIELADASKPMARLPEDDGPFGSMPPPMVSEPAHLIGT